jgi:hypothetical protein
MIDQTHQNSKSKQLALFELIRVATKAATTCRDTATLPKVDDAEDNAILFSTL